MLLFLVLSFCLFSFFVFSSLSRVCRFLCLFFFVFLLLFLRTNTNYFSFGLDPALLLPPLSASIKASLVKTSVELTLPWLLPPDVPVPIMLYKIR